VYFLLLNPITNQSEYQVHKRIHSIVMLLTPKRPLFVPGSAAARGSVKAARFRTAFV
jgi:hypothetical protein